MSDPATQYPHAHADGKLQRVYKAWNDEGIEPMYHQSMQARLRREWPVLAKALDALSR